MKRKSTKRTVLLLFTFAICGLLAGCSLLNFDASGYIKACLDANTHGEFAEYAKITGVSEEEAEQQYNDLLDQQVSYLSSYNLSEEKASAFRDLYVSIYKNFKYEVGDAVKNEDNSYSVPVTTYKLQIFKDIMKEGETYITDYVNQAIEAGKTPTEDEIYTAVTDYMFDSLSSNLNALEYAEPVNTTVMVTPEKLDSRTVYSVSQTDLQGLLESLIDIENAQ